MQLHSYKSSLVGQAFSMLNRHIDTPGSASADADWHRSIPFEGPSMRPRCGAVAFWLNSRHPKFKLRPKAALEPGSEYEMMAVTPGARTHIR